MRGLKLSHPTIARADHEVTQVASLYSPPSFSPEGLSSAPPSRPRAHAVLLLENGPSKGVRRHFAVGEQSARRGECGHFPFLSFRSPRRR